MKQLHINNAVIYLARTLVFIYLLVGLLLVSILINVGSIFYYLFIVPVLVVILIASISWSFFQFIVEIVKGREL